MGYLYLAIAIVSEVIGTSALKASEEFTRAVPSTVVILGYGVSFYFFALVLKTIPMGIAYAVWSGLGIVLIAVVGLVVFKQVPNTADLIGMSLIILGVIVIHVFSKTEGY
ncbi:UNVERIFIED_CONTAM: hypothetical protein GTU68_054358 [Idotea baltica]|nr:hypothetical protein [Idotea baltica]